MWTVRDNLHLGTEFDALDRSVLSSANVTHVVNCAREIDCPFSDVLSYLHLQLADPDQAFESCIDDACAFIDRGLAGGTVFVHCKGAISRSPSVILAYFCKGGLSLLDAATQLGRIVPTRPNDVFIRQLCTHFGTHLDEAGMGNIYQLLAGGDHSAQK